MRHLYGIASLKINGIANPTRMRMLAEYLWQQDIDVVLIQDVTSKVIEQIRNYTKYINIGTGNRWAAF
jgi:exonuclease III